MMIGWIDDQEYVLRLGASLADDSFGGALLKATAEGQTFYSHYVLTESQRAPSSDPLVLWQQGAPRMC